MPPPPLLLEALPSAVFALAEASAELAVGVGVAVLLAGTVTSTVDCPLIMDVTVLGSSARVLVAEVEEVEEAKDAGKEEEVAGRVDVVSKELLLLLVNAEYEVEVSDASDRVSNVPEEDAELLLEDDVEEEEEEEEGEEEEDCVGEALEDPALDDDDAEEESAFAGMALMSTAPEPLPSVYTVKAADPPQGSEGYPTQATVHWPWSPAEAAGASLPHRHSLPAVMAKCE